MDPRVAGYIDKIKRLYPYGVARQYIVASRASDTEQRLSSKGQQSVVASVRCALIAVLGTGHDSNPEQASLLEAICTKGLQLPLEHCTIRCVDDTGAVEVAAAESGAAVCIVFGGGATVGQVDTRKTMTLVHTYALDRIATDSSAKRDFWRQLQGAVLPMIAER